MKLLLILNENPPGAHSDVHHSLQILKGQGVLEDYHIYPFLARLADGLKDKEVTQEVLDIAKELQPSLVLWSHTGRLYVSKDCIDVLKNLSSSPSIGYWDGDIYQKPQPLPKEIILLCKLCNVVFAQGEGDFSNLLKRKGCKDIRYTPASTDTNRFCKLRPSDHEIQYDVVIIGNNVTSKLPWKTAPGSRWRKKLAQYFYEKLGERFAVFGYGWKSEYGKGPIRFDKQVDLYHSSRVVLGVNNWLGPRYYFSNRLPIAFSSGVPVVHNYESGYEEIFQSAEDFFFFKTTEEAWNMTKQLLEKDQSELDEIGLRAYKFALERFTMTEVMRYMITVLQDHKSAQWERKDLQIRANPWINAPQL